MRATIGKEDRAARHPGAIAPALSNDRSPAPPPRRGDRRSSAKQDARALDHHRRAAACGERVYRRVRLAEAIPATSVRKISFVHSAPVDERAP